MLPSLSIVFKSLFITESATPLTWISTGSIVEVTVAVLEPLLSTVSADICKVTSVFELCIGMNFGVWCPVVGFVSETS